MFTLLRRWHSNEALHGDSTGMCAICLVLALTYIPKAPAQRNSGTKSESNEARIPGLTADEVQTLRDQLWGLSHPTDNERVAADKYFEGFSLWVVRGDKALALVKWDQVATEFAGTQYADRCREYARIVRQMMADDLEYRKPIDLSGVSVQRQIAFWVYMLRDIENFQDTSPGRCRVLDTWQSKDNAAFQLYGFGKLAVPEMIELLDDNRLTRSVGHFRPWAPATNWILQNRDGAVEIIEAIANETFYNQSSTSSYFSNEKAEIRDAVIARIKDWWRKNEGRNEADWLKESVARKDMVSDWRSSMAIERLMQIEGRAGKEFLRERAAATGRDHEWWDAQLRKAEHLEK